MAPEYEEGRLPAPAAGAETTAAADTRAKLIVTTSADLTTDTRFDVIVNSVSPEFQSSGSDSGINYAVWKMLTGYSGEGDMPSAIQYAQTDFVARNGCAPTYADVLWSEVSEDKTPKGSALKFIVHALAPDLSNRPKRLPSGLSRECAFAALVAVYFRVLVQATVLGGPECSIGMPPLGSGVFANDAGDVRVACVLAHAAYRAAGGRATVSIALWSPDGAPPQDLSDWADAVAACPNDESVGRQLREALAPRGGPLLLAAVPVVHTTAELTSLLEASDDPQAKEFLIIREDASKAKDLKVQMADGIWTPLLRRVAESAVAPNPFSYPGFPASGDNDDLLRYMMTSEFLHFEPAPTIVVET